MPALVDYPKETIIRRDRVDLRKFRHRIRAPYDRYSPEILQWLAANVGSKHIDFARNTVRLETGIKITLFNDWYFKRKDHAVLFKLTWSE